MSEVDLMRAIQIRASEMGHRLFRNNVGLGWAGEQVRVSHTQMVMMREGDILIRGARALHAGLCPGSSDLIGLTSSGRFIACEVKAPKKTPTDQQESFLAMVDRMGGIGIVAKTLEDFKI